ncbi:Pao retrotransposon peptidase family protein, partial [Aphelenchoides avenae]
MAYDDEQEVLLPTKKVDVLNPATCRGSTPKESQGVISNALIDEGSQLSFITNKLARRLGLEPIGERTLLISTISSTNAKAETLPVYEVLIPSKSKNQFLSFEVCGRDQLLKELTAGEVLNSEAEIGETEMIHLAKGEVVSVNAGLSKSEGLAEIKDDLEKLWQWENIGIRDNPQVDDDDVALEQFQKSLRFVDGRYEAGWPWISDDPELSTNLAIARRRLIGTWQRLAKSPELLNKYDQVIKEQENLGIIELAPLEKDRSDNAPLVTYLPHHPVVREDKATTKVRIVYDASAKGGPAGMLLRFRVGRIVIAADIEKAFLQISLRESDRDVTRFLWLKDPSKGISDDNVVVYRFARIPFGVISSPFILAATIREHLKREASLLAEEIKQDIYSDNVLLFANSESEAIEKCRRAYQIFKRANMNLREFVSNNAAVNFAFGDHGKEFASKFLGVHWDPRTDLLEYVIAVDEEDFLQAPTKRIVLQKLAKIFDPLGLLSPVVFLGKTFLQDLWRC